jgi:hypothetical protein
MARLLTDPAQLSVHLKNGQQAAENIAQNTIENVRRQIGL